MVCVRAALAFSILLAICRCSTLHTPRTFPPYFASLPESAFSPRHVYEIRDLESRAELTLLQLKRLFDLYSLEYSTGRSDSNRATLKQKLEGLRPAVGEFEDEVRSVARTNRAKNAASKREEEAITDTEIRSRLSEAQSLWNRDFNDEALEILQPLREAQLNDSGLLKIEYLYFRIILEKGDLAVAEQSYARIGELQDCGFESGQAALLLSLRYFAAGNASQAREIFSRQCDNEATASQYRREYWMARFSEVEADRKAKLERLANLGIPEFYALMAQLQLNLALERPPLPETPRKYLVEPLSVSRSVHQLLTRAEETLDSNLKRDASVFLMRAGQLLRDDSDEDDLAATLYAIHLFQAAGNHLEAMKLFNWLPTLAPKAAREAMAHPQLIREMFPTPFLAQVEFLAQTWQVDPDLVFALMRQESAFNPAAISVADARGLMQLMPFLAKFLAKRWNYDSYYQPRNLLNAEENLKLAIFHLHQLQELVPHLALIAASYNAGVQRATNWWKKLGGYPLDVFIELIPIQETRNYVKYVIRNYCYYKALRTGRADLALVVPQVLPPIPGFAPVSEMANDKVNAKAIEIPVEMAIEKAVEIDSGAAKIESPQGNP